MELTGDLKKQIDKAESNADAKESIENEGMKLKDDELNKVAGGSDPVLLEGLDENRLKTPLPLVTEPSIII